MKKLVLIPTAILATTSPIISLAGCNQGKTPEPEHDYSKDYLTFTAIEDCTFSLSNNKSTPDSWRLPHLAYSVDNGSSWKRYYIQRRGRGEEITLKKGKQILFRGYNVDGFSGMLSHNPCNTSFVFSKGYVDISGNIMSLINDESFQDIDVPNEFCFCYLFTGTVKPYAHDISNLILPSTNLTEGSFTCFLEYQKDVCSLPKFPTEHLANSCYSAVFYQTPISLPISESGDPDKMFIDLTQYSSDSQLPQGSVDIFWDHELHAGHKYYWSPKS